MMKIEPRRKPRPVEALRVSDIERTRCWAELISLSIDLSIDIANGRYQVMRMVPDGADCWRRQPIPENEWIVLYDDWSVRLFSEKAFAARFQKKAANP